MSTRKPTEREKQKFLEYVERKRLEARKNQLLKSNRNNEQKSNLNPKQPSSNLFIILIDDFFEKIDALEQFQAYPQEKRDNFKANIADEILGKTSFRLLQDIKEVDREFLDDMSLVSSLLDDTNLEEFFYKLDLLISKSTYFSERYLAHLVAVYIELCEEFSIAPDTIVIPYIRN